MALRLSFDTGGTFTDIALVDSTNDEVHTWKTPTTPEDPSAGVAAGVEEILRRNSVLAADVQDAVRGATTLVTNTLLERSGALTGLVTTAGFADVVEIGREWRYDIYDLTITFPAPLVEPQHRFEVRERIDAEGRVDEPIHYDDLETIARAVEAACLEALAVCFLHSYRNGVHERDAVRWLRARLPGLPIVASANGVAEIREYERFSTAIAGAYVAPVTERHLRDLQRSIEAKGVRPEVFLMHSGGGLMSSGTASTQPIRLIESGPAAGALGAAFIAGALGESRVVAFDMGGTTAKICVVDDGKPLITSEFEAAREHRFKKGSGIPLVGPTVDLLEIGAGGGSIARVDSQGLLELGPGSAGAVPGPACYQRGGSEPTVTDADLCLGYVSPTAFLDGRMPLDVGAAERAIDEAVARSLNIDVTSAAAGIGRVVDENMAIAARIHLLEKGRDPRHYTLIAFGGAGPVHSRQVADRIGMRRVICPTSAGVLSAVGLQTARSSVDFARSDHRLLSEIDWHAVDTMFGDIAAEAGDKLSAMGVRDATYHRSADMRYVGQGYEINVPLDFELRQPGCAETVADRFRDAYEQLFAARPRFEEALEILRWRVRADDAEGVTFALDSLARGERRERDLEASQTGERPIYDPTVRGFVPARVYSHYSLPGGVPFVGPAVVEQRESTAVLFSADRGEIDRYGNLVIDLGNTAGAGSP